MLRPTYRGRFAPSPTGPLHFGSLVAAVGSYLDAKSHRGTWLVRIEDIDTHRNVAGAADAILRTLESFSLHWDESATYQSDRLAYYREAMIHLASTGRSFPCTCSRKDLGGRPYPGTCRSGVGKQRDAHAIRFRVTDELIGIDDRLQGTFSQHLEQEVGDFVIRRTDGLFAYHLAVVVDDIDQGISHIVRGVDLLGSAPRQTALASALGGQAFSYLHLPIAIDKNGAKLSKQTAAPAIHTNDPGQELHTALTFLGLTVPSDLAKARPADILGWAVDAWSLRSVPAGPTIPVEET